MSYGEVDRRRRYIGSALSSMFRDGQVGGGEYDTVGIWSQNRPGMFNLPFLAMGFRPSSPEWQIIEIALQSYNKVSVSLYDTLGNDAVG